ncbi:MAG: hypothetical protein ABH830_00930, partial [Patescibacteria group bacterium]
KIMLIMIRNIILAIGWPVLLIGSIYLIIKGKDVYKLVKGSMIGEVTRALVISMLVGMYSLGIVATALMFCELKGTYLVLPIFLLWFITFVWSLKVLIKAQKEAKKLTQ